MLTCRVGDVDYAIKAAAANLRRFPSSFPLRADFFAAAVRYNRHRFGAADSEYRADIVFLHRRLHTPYKSRIHTAHIVRPAWVEG